MNQDIRQQLSALIDGELERDQARFLLRRLPGDQELIGCWQRWHVAGDCLKGAAPAPLRVDFIARIAAQIDGEPVPGRRITPETLRWAAGVAVAASVALAALIAVRPDAVPETGIAAVPDVEVAPSPYREEDLRPSLRTQTVASSELAPYAASMRIDPRIEGYLVRHNEATAAQGHGFVSYVSLVTPLRERAPTATAENPR